jgi:hypothetical protein
MEGEKMNSIKAIPKSSWAILIAALIVVGTLIIYFGAWIGAIFLCAVAALGGLAMFLKSKDIVLRISGLIFMGIGLLFLFLLPAWLTSFHIQTTATDMSENQPDVFSRIVSIEEKQGQLQVAFCSQPPGSGDWIPRPTLELDGRILMASGGTRLAEDGCWQVMFDTEAEPGKESKAVFHINRWVLSLEEGQALKLTSDPEMLLKACQQAREDLKARGFAFTCQPDAGKSFGLDTQVSRQPDSYSAADTRMVILESITGEVVWSDWQEAIRIP